MSDIVPYFVPFPVTKAARDKRAADQRHSAAMEEVKSEARQFEYRALTGLQILDEYIQEVSQVDRDLTNTCGDRPALMMDLRLLIQNANAAFGMANARFMRGQL